MTARTWLAAATLFATAAAAEGSELRAGFAACDSLDAWNKQTLEVLKHPRNGRLLTGCVAHADAVAIEIVDNYLSQSVARIRFIRPDGSRGAIYYTWTANVVLRETP